MNKSVYVKCKEDALAIVILLVLPLLYLKGALFFTENILGSPFTDIKGEAYGKLFVYGELSKFSLPLWSPYLFGGMPYAASPSAAVFYPFHLLCALLPINYAINWSIALHLFLSEIFTYYLLRNYGVSRLGSMIAGITYAFSAPQIMHIYAGHLIAVTSMPWTPLMLLSLDKILRIGDLKYGVLLSIAIALQLLAGYPQYQFYSLIAIFFYCFFTMINLFLKGNDWSEIGKKSLFFVLFVFLGMVVSAIQIFPTKELISYSTRENLSYEFVSVFSYPPANLITLLIPDFFGDQVKTPYWGRNYLWEMTAYVGILPTLLAVIAVFYARRKVVWFFAGLTLVSIILAMGKYTPLLKYLYHYVPGFNMFRGNSKFIFLTALSLSVLSGFGLDALMKGSESKKRLRAFAGIIFVTVVGLSLMYLSLDGPWFRKAINNVVSSPDLFNNPVSFTGKGFENTALLNFRNNFYRSGLLMLASAAVIFLYIYGKIRELFAVIAILGIIILDLFTFGMRYMVSFDIRNTYLDREIINFLKADKEPFRLLAPQFDPNIGTASGIETLDGYGNMMIKRYSEFTNFSQGLSPDNPVLYLNLTIVNNFTNLLNAKYILLPSGEKLDNPTFSQVYINGRYSVYRNNNALPRAFVVHEAKVIKERDSILREIASPDFVPAKQAVIEEGVEFKDATGQSPTPRFIEYSPDRSKIEAYLNSPGLLVLGDVYYPGWKAYVDGKETKIYKANYIMRAVTLSEGRHLVEFRYDPTSFKLGAIISLTSLVFVAGFLIWDWRKNENIKGSAQ